MNFKDHSEISAIDKTSAPKEIKHTRRKLAGKYHPNSIPNYRVEKNKGAACYMKLLSIIVFSCLLAFACKKQTIPMVITSSDPMVQKFYTANHKTLFWLSSKKNSEKATEWLTEMESAKSFGFVSDKIQIDQVRVALLNKKNIDISLKDSTDQQMTGLVLNFLRDLQQGSIKFDYDEVNISRD